MEWQVEKDDLVNFDYLVGRKNPQILLLNCREQFWNKVSSRKQSAARVIITTLDNSGLTNNLVCVYIDLWNTI